MSICCGKNLYHRNYRQKLPQFPQSTHMAERIELFFLGNPKYPYTLNAHSIAPYPKIKAILMQYASGSGHCVEINPTTI